MLTYAVLSSQRISSILILHGSWRKNFKSQKIPAHSSKPYSVIIMRTVWGLHAAFWPCVGDPYCSVLFSVFLYCWNQNRTELTFSFVGTQIFFGKCLDLRVVSNEQIACIVIHRRLATTGCDSREDAAIYAVWNVLSSFQGPSTLLSWNRWIQPTVLSAHFLNINFNIACFFVCFPGATAPCGPDPPHSRGL